MRTAKPIVPISPAEQEFFQEFYQQYRRTIYAASSKVIHPGDDVDDLAQSTAEHLMRQIPKLMSLESYKISGYIFRTAANTYTDILRRRKGRTLVPLDEEIIADLNRIEWDFVPELSRKWEIQQLRELLEPREWAVLEEYYKYGYSQAEIGKHLGIAPASVRMLLSRIRRKSRGILRPEELTRGW